MGRRASEAEGLEAFADALSRCPWMSAEVPFTGPLKHGRSDELPDPEAAHDHPFGVASSAATRQSERFLNAGSEFHDAPFGALSLLLPESV